MKNRIQKTTIAAAALSALLSHAALAAAVDLGGFAAAQAASAPTSATISPAPAPKQAASATPPAAAQPTTPPLRPITVLPAPATTAANNKTAVASKPPTALASSIATVEELLKIDNAQALEKARADALKTGMMDGNGAANASKVGTTTTTTTGNGMTGAPPAASVWAINSIYGVNGKLKAEIVVTHPANSSVVQFLDNSVGSIIEGCEIVSITSQSISTRPVAVAGKKAKKATPAACPAVKRWTGHELAEELRTKTATASSATAQQPMQPMVPALQPQR